MNLSGGWPAVGLQNEFGCPTIGLGVPIASRCPDTQSPEDKA